jgi:hypothetical protein
LIKHSAAKNCVLGAETIVVKVTFLRSQTVKRIKNWEKRDGICRQRTRKSEIREKDANREEDRLRSTTHNREIIG